MKRLNDNIFQQILYLHNSSVQTSFNLLDTLLRYCEPSIGKPQTDKSKRYFLSNNVTS